jgi:hypothetical protein
LKEYVCLQVGHHRDIGRLLWDYQKRGWILHTYQAAHADGYAINHYLLLEKAGDLMEIKCPHCQRKILKTGSYCPNCGSFIE